MEDRLRRMEERLCRIEALLNKIVGSCDNMDHHIGFINGVYETVRSPLDYIVSRISGSQEHLPAIVDAAE